MALIGLIDSRRQQFKAKIGLDADGVPGKETFCPHAILGTDVMVAESALAPPDRLLLETTCALRFSP